MRNIEYIPPKGFTSLTAVEPLFADAGQIIFPMDQPLRKTPDFQVVPTALTESECLEVQTLIGKKEEKLPNYPKRQQIWPDEYSGWLYERCGELLNGANAQLGLALAGFVEPVTVLT